MKIQSVLFIRRNIVRFYEPLKCQWTFHHQFFWWYERWGRDVCTTCFSVVHGRRSTGRRTDSIVYLYTYMFIWCVYIYLAKFWRSEKIWQNLYCVGRIIWSWLHFDLNLRIFVKIFQNLAETGSWRNFEKKVKKIGEIKIFLYKNNSIFVFLPQLFMRYAFFRIRSKPEVGEVSEKKFRKLVKFQFFFIRIVRSLNFWLNLWDLSYLKIGPKPEVSEIKNKEKKIRQILIFLLGKIRSLNFGINLRDLSFFKFGPKPEVSKILKEKCRKFVKFQIFMIRIIRCLNYGLNLRNLNRFKIGLKPEVSKILKKSEKIRYIFIFLVRTIRSLNFGLNWRNLSFFKIEPNRKLAKFRKKVQKIGEILICL